MSTELSVQPSTGITFYDRINDPLEAVDRWGKVLAQAGACGCQTEAQGKLVVLACLCEKKSPFDIDRRYHLMNGKLSMKSDVMLAELRARGGKHKWIKDGTDGQEAVIELTYDGQSYTSRYTMDDAEKAKLVKAGGGWEKNPANMLRARAISNGVRMIAPEISAGIYTPEEREDIAADNGQASQAAPHRTAEEVAARRAELQRMQQQQQEEVIDAQVAKDAPTEAAPFKADEKADPQLLAEIDAALKQLGMSRGDLESRLKQKNPEFTTVSELTPEAAGTLLANLHTRISTAAKN